MRLKPHFASATVCLLLAGLLTAAAQGQQTSVTALSLRPQHLALDAAAARLEESIQQATLDAQVLIESKNKVVVVRGTPDTLRKVSKLWLNIDRASGNKPRVLFASALKQGASQSATHALQNISSRELERQVQSTWKQMSFQAEANDNIVSARLPGAERAVLTIDHIRQAVKIEGPARVVEQWTEVIEVLDAKPGRDDQTATLVSLEKADPAKVQQALKLIKQLQAGNPARGAQPVGQQPPAGEQPNDQPPRPDNPPPPAAEGEMEEEDESGPIGPVEITIMEAIGGDKIIVRGRRADVQRVLRIIRQIEEESKQTQPVIEVLQLKHVNDRAVADLIAQIYDAVFGSRISRVSITPLIKPNALLLVGSEPGVAAVKELIAKLDQPVAPQSQLRVFPLKHISALDAETTVRTFFVTRAPETTERTGLGTRVNVVAEVRSNSLIVQASSRDLAELSELLRRIDVAESPATSEVRVFRLQNALSEDLAPVLQSAITGQAATGAAGQGQGTGTTGQTRSPNASLQLLQIDAQGRRILESGILSDVRVTADPRGNSLVVRGPATSMELIGALIEQLDQLPSAGATIKVFTLVNGDAQTLITSLQQLFGQATGTGGGGGAQALLQSVTGGGENTLVPLRFALDQRTNSIIVSGAPGDIDVVERILYRLDEGDIRRRRTTVYRLRNAPAIDVSNAINQFLQNQRQLTQIGPGLVSTVEQIEREVVVVPEPVSNSLLVSATPRYYEEIKKIVEDLDRRPPMVVIQVLIAEVNLGNVDEFGVELGLQDSLLFDRGIPGVGFNFNNQPLGNSNTFGRENLAGQGLTNFALGRTNSDLGYGGLVLSASNESVSLLIRALQQANRIQIISRPQVQTLDNQAAFVQVGARVPYVTSSNQTTFGIQNQITLENVGLLLNVIPRTSPDGLIVMQVSAEKSNLSSEAQGIPTFISNTGQVVRSPQIFIQTAQTTVSAQSGQTVILGGLITQNREQETRRTPYLSDIPVLGRLFRYDREINRKSELLIIMTPYIVRTDEDIERINARESERMNWCLADVANIHGELPWARGVGPWNEKKTPLIFPDENPTGESPTTNDTEPPPAGAPERRFDPVDREPTPDGVFEQQPR